MDQVNVVKAQKDSGVPAEARDFGVRDRVVLITGGGQGIGRELARQFASAGAIPVVADLNVDSAARVEEEIVARGGRAKSLRVDVADAASVQAMVDVQTPVIKFIYALAAGCASVVKPSDTSPLSAIMLAEVIDKAGIPAGVFNLVIGKGRVVGEAMASHPDVDLVSFTGSTGAGAHVGEAAARTIKRASLELGGKSANIVLPDVDLEKAARWNIQRCFFNTGQSCHAPSRMLVHESQMEKVMPYLAGEASKYVIGDPRDPATTMGPAVSRGQFETIQRYIQAGLDDGARLVHGGPGRPEGLDRGYFVKPTVFADVAPEMTIAREEIFGPVLAVVPYATEADAVRIANDSVYGLGGYVFAGDREAAYRVASQLQAGRVCFNGAATNSLTPMGGYKQSGIGRSMGVFGLEEYLEIKSVYGFAEEAAELTELAH